MVCFYVHSSCQAPRFLRALVCKLRHRPQVKHATPKVDNQRLWARCRQAPPLFANNSHLSFGSVCAGSDLSPPTHPVEKPRKKGAQAASHLRRSRVVAKMRPSRCCQSSTKKRTASHLRQGKVIAKRSAPHAAGRSPVSAHLRASRFAWHPLAICFLFLERHALHAHR